MAEQEKLEQGKEEPRALTLEEKWQMDEEMQADGSSNYQVFTPQCRSCQFAKKGALEECRKYYAIPWEILTVQESCPYYQEQQLGKIQIDCVVIREKQEILEYEFLPESALRELRKFPAFAVWAYDEDTPVGCAIFTQESDENSMLAVLQYICTQEDYRRLGIAAKIMKKANEYCEKNGMIHMRAYVEYDASKMEVSDELECFFQAIDWETCPNEWQGLEYHPESFISERLKTYAQENINGIYKLSSQMRRRVLAEKQEVPLELKHCLQDNQISENSLICLQNDRVNGAVILEKRKEYQMCIRYLYVNPECKNKTILLNLLAEIIKNRENWSGKGKILICASETKIANLAEYLFGKPVKRLMRRKYQNMR